MKKFAALAVLLAVVAGAWWWWSNRVTGAPPTVTATLSAEHTVGFVTVQDLDGLTGAFLEAIERIPEADRQGPMKMLTDSAARQSTVGFDPATVDGWQSIGIDPKPGATVVIDGRLMARMDPVPVLLVKVTDRAKLLAFLEKRAGQKAEIDSSAKPLEKLTTGGETLMLGERQGYTAILLGPARKQVKVMEGFTAFLNDSAGGLGGEKPVARAFDGAEDLYFGAYLSGQGLVNLFKGQGDSKLGKTATEVAQYYVDRFPGMGLWVGKQASGGRLVATDAGVSLIQKLLVPAKKPPKFSEFVPAKGWSAVRFSVNLKDLFSGIGDALPPVGELEKAKSQIGMAPMMLPMVLGFGWDDLTGALSGHVVFAFNGKSLAKLAQDMGPNVEAVLLLGVNDGDKADKLLPSLLKQLDKVMPGGEIGPATVGGHSGHQVKLGPMTLAVVRVDDVLVAGPLAAVEAAVKRPDGEHLTDKDAAAALDDADVIEGVFYDASSLAAWAGMADGAKIEKLLGSAVIAGSVRHDKHGMYGKTDVMGVSSMAGLAAGLLVPAFQQYIQRSKDAMRRLEDAQKRQDEALKALQADDEAQPARPELAAPPSAVPASQAQ